jgi:hypothetical protein
MWILIVNVLVIVVAGLDCSQLREAEEVRWRDVSYGFSACTLAASVTNKAVWAISAEIKHPTGNFYIAQYDERNKRWAVDSTMPAGASPTKTLAVDPQGNPAFIGQNQRLYWKREGKWRDMGRAAGIAFGGDGSAYKIGTQSNRLFKYSDWTNRWE